jgi:Transcription factor e(y)2
VKRVADQMTILRGERPVLKDFVVQTLQESGWDDKVRLMCREEIAKSNGLISVDNLVDKVKPKARREIPDELKAEMIAKIKQVLLKAHED